MGSIKTSILQSKLLLSHMLHVELWVLVEGLLLRGLEEVRGSLGSICIMVFSSCLSVSLSFIPCIFQEITLEIQTYYMGKEQLLQSPRYSRPTQKHKRSLVS